MLVALRGVELRVLMRGIGGSVAQSVRSSLMLVVLVAACTPLKGARPRDAGNEKTGKQGTRDGGPLDGSMPVSVVTPDTGVLSLLDAGSDVTSASTSDGGTSCVQEGTLRCAGNSGGRQRCMAGAWAATDACQTGEVCSADPASVGTCLSVADVCKGNAGKPTCDGQGVMYQCSAEGVAESQDGCLSARHCQVGLAAGHCAVCLPGDYRCTGATLESCNDDGQGYMTAKQCDSAAMCSATAGDCTTATCLPGKFSCQGDMLRKCNASQDGWDGIKNCGAGLCDAAGGECDVCVPQTKSCDVGSIVTCNATGQGYDRVACSASTSLCVGNGQCVQCASDADCSDPGACFVKHCNLATGVCQPDVAGSQTTCGNSMWCDGAGNCVNCLYDRDCSDPGECKVRYCNTTTHACEPQAAPITVTCAAGHCDSGACVQCSNASECSDYTCQTKSCTSGQCKYTPVPTGQPGNCTSGVCTASQQCKECVSDPQCTYLNGACTQGSCNTSTNSCRTLAVSGSCGTLKVCSGTNCVDSCGNASVDTGAGEQCDPAGALMNNWTCNSTNCQSTGLSAGSSGTAYRKQCSVDGDCAPNEMCAISFQLEALFGMTAKLCLPKCTSAGQCQSVPGYLLYSSSGSTACTTQISCAVSCSGGNPCPPGVTCNGGVCGGPYF